MIESAEEKKICDALNAEGDRGSIAAMAMVQHVVAMGATVGSVPVSAFGRNYVVSVCPVNDQAVA